MNTVQVKVPELSESVSEATLLEWKRKLGDIVAADEILIEIETDKVVLEVPSPAVGYSARHAQQLKDLQDAAFAPIKGFVLTA